MPPRATHRVRLVIVPGEGRVPPAAEVLARMGESAGVLLAGGGAVRSHDAAREHFLANEQGGMHVCCPRTGELVALPASRAIQRWRDGGPRELDCACGSRHDLAELVYAPPAVFADRWIEVLEPVEIEVRRGTTLDEAWPGWRSILVRG